MASETMRDASQQEERTSDHQDTSAIVMAGDTVLASPQLPYSAFSNKQKRSIVALIAFAGWFSSLSSFIYFPAIPFLAADLDVSIERINLTVTAYLIMSGIFPSVIGDAADTIGRRPVLIVTLVIYVAANIGLALQSSFGLLFFLRMVQSAGISGSYAVAYGVIGDLFAPADRGGYSGLVSFILNTPPSIGPVISGLLMEKWGWRSIFWFLSAISPCCLISIVLFLPETSRKLVGDGSLASKGLNRVLIPFLVPKKRYNEPSVSGFEQTSFHFPNPLKSLALIGKPGTAIVIGSVGIWYTIYSCLQASLSSLFTQKYQVSGLISGLTYLPFGIACAISAFATGKILNIDYRHTAAKYGLPAEKNKNHDLAVFPVEEARLRSLRYSLLLCSVLVMVYGWLLQYQVNMAAPLAIQFLIGLSIQGVFTALSTLLVDIHPDAPSTAQAASNFVRCELAAGGIAILDILLQRLGSGWTFILFAVIGLITLPCLHLLQKKGLRWRQKGSVSLEIGVEKSATKA